MQYGEGGAGTINPIRQAIVQAIAGNTAVTSLLSAQGAIYHRVAPRTARTPFVIIDKQGGSVRSVFGGGGVTEDRWMVKAVDQSTSASRAEDIDTALRNVLDGTTLSLANGLTGAVIAESDVDYGEMDGDTQYQHVGAVYRVLDP